MSTRNLSRKEEIRNASVAYNEKYGKLLVIGGDSILSEEEYLEFNKNPSFIAGAEWADRTMLDKVYDFIIANVYKYGKVKFVDDRVTFDFRMNTFLNDLKQAVEE